MGWSEGLPGTSSLRVPFSMIESSIASSIVSWLKGTSTRVCGTLQCTTIVPALVGGVHCVWCTWGVFDEVRVNN